MKAYGRSDVFIRAFNTWSGSLIYFVDIIIIFLPHRVQVLPLFSIIVLIIGDDFIFERFAAVSPVWCFQGLASD